VAGGSWKEGNWLISAGFCGPGSDRLLGLLALTRPSGGRSGLPKVKALADAATLRAAAEAAALTKSLRRVRSVMWMSYGISHSLACQRSVSVGNGAGLKFTRRRYRQGVRRPMKRVRRCMAVASAAAWIIGSAIDLRYSRIFCSSIGEALWMRPMLRIEGAEPPFDIVWASRRLSVRHEITLRKPRASIFLRHRTPTPSHNGIDYFPIKKRQPASLCATSNTHRVRCCTRSLIRRGFSGDGRKGELHWVRSSYASCRLAACLFISRGVKA